MYGTGNPYEALLKRQQQQPMASSPQQQSPVQAQPMERPQQIQGDARMRKNAKAADDGSGGGGGLMSMLSDKNSKEQIQKLESANKALSSALSSKAEYPDTSMASSGMQALGQQRTFPSQASFPDEPAATGADKVAAQNAGIAASEGAPPPMMAQAQPSAGFQVNRGMPDLSSLDEAYRRMGKPPGY